MSDSNTDEINVEELLNLITKDEANFQKAAEDNPTEYKIIQEIRLLMAQNKSVLALNGKGEKFFVKFFRLEYRDNKQVWQVEMQKESANVFYVVRVMDCRYFYKDSEGNLQDVFVLEPTEESEGDTNE